MSSSSSAAAISSMGDLPPLSYMEKDGDGTPTAVPEPRRGSNRRDMQQLTQSMRLPSTTQPPADRRAMLATARRGRFGSDDGMLTAFGVNVVGFDSTRVVFGPSRTAATRASAIRRAPNGGGPRDGPRRKSVPPRSKINTDVSCEEDEEHGGTSSGGGSGQGRATKSKGSRPASILRAKSDNSGSDSDTIRQRRQPVAPIASPPGVPSSSTETGKPIYASSPRPILKNRKGYNTATSAQGNQGPSFPGTGGTGGTMAYGLSLLAKSDPTNIIRSISNSSASDIDPEIGATIAAGKSSGGNARSSRTIDPSVMGKWLASSTGNLLGENMIASVSTNVGANVDFKADDAAKMPRGGDERRWLMQAETSMVYSDASLPGNEDLLHTWGPQARTNAGAANQVTSLVGSDYLGDDENERGGIDDDDDENELDGYLGLESPSSKALLPQKKKFSPPGKAVRVVVNNDPPKQDYGSTAASRGFSRNRQNEMALFSANALAGVEGAPPGGVTDGRAHAESNDGMHSEADSGVPPSLASPPLIAAKLKLFTFTTTMKTFLHPTHLFGKDGIDDYQEEDDGEYGGDIHGGLHYAVKEEKEGEVAEDEGGKATQNNRNLGHGTSFQDFIQLNDRRDTTTSEEITASSDEGQVYFAKRMESDRKAHHYYTKGRGRFVRQFLNKMLYNPAIHEFTSLQQFNWALILGLVMGVFTAKWGQLIEYCVDIVWSEVPERLLEWGVFTELDGAFPLPHYMWICPAIFGGIVSYINAILPVPIPGQNEWIESLHRVGIIDHSTFLSVVLVATAGMASGLSLGPELPLVLSAGMAGSYLGLVTRQSILSARTLNITAASAAVGGFFGFPMAGAVFVLEIPHRMGLQYFEALSPATIASIVAVLTNRMVTGNDLKGFFQYPFLSATLPSSIFYEAVVYGLVGSVIGVLYTEACKKIKMNVHDWFHEHDDHHGDDHGDGHQEVSHNDHGESDHGGDAVNDSALVVKPGGEVATSEIVPLVPTGAHSEHKDRLNNNNNRYAAILTGIFSAVKKVCACISNLKIRNEPRRAAVVGVIAGFLNGVVCMFVPHTLFWGEAQLQTMIDRGKTALPVFGHGEETTADLLGFGYCVDRDNEKDDGEVFIGTGCMALIAVTKVLTIGLSLGTGIVGGHFWGPLFVGAGLAHVFTDVMIYVSERVNLHGFMTGYPCVGLLCIMGSAHVVSFRAHTAISLILTLTISAFDPMQGTTGGLNESSDYSAVFPLLVISCFISLMITRGTVFYKQQRSRGDIIATAQVLSEPKAVMDEYYEDEPDDEEEVEDDREETTNVTDDSTNGGGTVVEESPSEGTSQARVVNSESTPTDTSMNFDCVAKDTNEPKEPDQESQRGSEHSSNCGPPDFLRSSSDRSLSSGNALPKHRRTSSSIEGMPASLKRSDSEKARQSGARKLRPGSSGDLIGITKFHDPIFDQALQKALEGRARTLLSSKSSSGLMDSERGRALPRLSIIDDSKPKYTDGGGLPLEQAVSEKGLTVIDSLLANPLAGTAAGKQKKPKFHRRSRSDAIAMTTRTSTDVALLESKTPADKSGNRRSSGGNVPKPTHRRGRSFEGLTSFHTELGRQGEEARISAGSGSGFSPTTRAGSGSGLSPQRNGPRNVPQSGAALSTEDLERSWA